MLLPPELLALPTIEAEPWLKIDSDENKILEGPAFDRDGNLFVTSPSHGIVYKITDNDKISMIFNNRRVIVDGSAFHKDGRLFIACLSGELLIMDPDGSNVTIKYPEYNGERLSINDLVFDCKGNIYVTDFKGTVMEPDGGIYRLSSDGEEVQQVLHNLCSPNGISLSPEGNVLWVGETTRNAVLRVALLEDGITTIPIDGVIIAYYSTGHHGPDSNKVDLDGNLYQCIMGQGRVLVINEHGIPIANVVVSGSEEGKYLRTSNLAFKPGTNEGYITTSGKGGAWICRFRGITVGLPLFSHFRD